MNEKIEPYTKEPYPVTYAELREKEKREAKGRKAESGVHGIR